MHRGYIKLYRKVCDHEYWLAEPFTKAQSWIDLILLARHKSGYIYIRNIEIFLKRGQLAWSEVSLASRWKWSKNKVRRFLKSLKTKHQIEQQTNNVTSIITIVNYNSYHDNETANDTANDTADDTADDTAKGQQKDSRRHTNKNDKQNKQEKKENNINNITNLVCNSNIREIFDIGELLFFFNQKFSVIWDEWDFKKTKSRYGFDRLKNHIESLILELEKGTKIPSPIGWLKESLEKNWILKEIR